MLRRVGYRMAVSAAVVAATVGGAASPAWAPKYILGSLAFGDCEMESGESSFSGDLTVLSFAAEGGQLYVTGALTGVCVDGLDITATVPGDVYRFPVVSLLTECVDGSAVVEIRPGAATVGAVLGDKSEAVKLVLDLYPSTVIDRTWVAGDPESVRGRLCAIDRMAARRVPADLARALNELVLRV